MNPINWYGQGQNAMYGGYTMPTATNFGNDYTSVFSTPSMSTASIPMSDNFDLSGLNQSLGVNMNTSQPQQGMLGNLSEGISKNQAAISGIAQGIQGLANFYQSFNASKAQKQQIALAKDQWNTNKANYKTTTNNALWERQNKAVSANPNAQSVDSYMDKWGIK